ncbi:PKD domain-containing protein [Mangrovivirga cuniculi]|uniref:PKD domain-containing protein n=1 Tax=Mangrovivirga cuniculi TaxID=2715131 RepID=A0A4D7JRZ5_9BACT|nr:PKD domain-containing protein [Mangrovivirga cuniculi]QCK14686.1 hypothetical protein DCC35_08000 [Mangrovivirga cuniculi]
MFADNTTTDKDFIILEYNIFNSSTSPINDFYISLLSDYSINEDSSNRLFTDVESQLTYAFDANNNIYTGIAAINTDNFISRGIDLSNYNGNSSDINLPFTKTEKADFILNNLKNEAGLNGNGNDIAGFSGTKITSLNSGELKNVVFVITAGNSLEALKENISTASEAYAQIKQSPENEFYTTICKGENAEINPGNSIFNFYSDPTGSNKIGNGGSFLIENLQNDTTIYYNSHDVRGMGIMKTAIINIDVPQDSFSISSNPLYLSESSDSTVTFKAYPSNAKSYNWVFENGLTSTNQNQTIKYNQEGYYDITLTIESPFGCENKFSSTLEVINRPNKPDIKNTYYEVCKNEDLEILIELQEELYFFRKSDMNDLISSGNKILISNIDQDTAVYVSRKENNIYSEPVKIIIKSYQPNANFQFSHNPDPASGASVLVEADDNTHVSYDWNINGLLLTETPLVQHEILNSEDQYFELKVIDSMGCSGTIQKTLSPRELNVMIKDTILICHDSQVVKINPDEEGTYLYYTDSELTNLVHKGRYYEKPLISSTDSIYIVNFTEFHKSSPQKVILRKLPESKPVIIANNESLNLASNKTVNLTIEKKEFVKYQWQFPNGATATRLQIEYSFSEPGLYSFSLIGTDSLGCNHTGFITIEVVNEPLLDIDDDLTKLISLFPNPASDYLFIKSEKIVEDWKIIDAAGNEIENGQGNTINISPYAAGIYYLIVNKKALPFIKN